MNFLSRLSYFLMLSVLVSCSGVKKVPFENYVDTSSKKINIKINKLIPQQVGFRLVINLMARD